MGVAEIVRARVVHGRAGAFLVGCVDHGSDLAGVREALRLLLREHEPLVDEHVEHAAVTGLEGAIDAVPVLQLGRQTGGHGKVPSLGAVDDSDVHGGPPGESFRGSAHPNRVR